MPVASGYHYQFTMKKYWWKGRWILRNQSLQNSTKFSLSELFEIIIPLFTNCKLLSETHCLHRFTIIFLLFEVCMSQFVIYREIRKTKILKSTNSNVAVFFFIVSFATLMLREAIFSRAIILLVKTVNYSLEEPNFLNESTNIKIIENHRRIIQVIKYSFNFALHKSVKKTPCIVISDCKHCMGDICWKLLYVLDWCIKVHIESN